MCNTTPFPNAHLALDKKAASPRVSYRCRTMSEANELVRSTAPTTRPSNFLTDEKQPHSMPGVRLFLLFH